MKKRLVVFTLLISLITASLPVPNANAAVENVTSEPQVIFNAIKTDGSGSAKEFVSLYNASLETVNLNGWVIEYTEQLGAGGFDTCQTADWINVKKKLTLPNVTLDSKATYSVYVGSMLDDKPGVVRLLSTDLATDEMLVQDLAGWGSEDKLPFCFEKAPAQIPGNNQLISRCMDETGFYRDTNDNSKDFVVASLEDFTAPACPMKEPVIEASCDGVIVTEILPNPSGTDKGNEFIELHNPTTDFIDLNGCELLTNDGDVYKFTASIEIEPGEYKALYDQVTGISLTNSRSVEVTFASLTTEYPAAPYPANLKDNISWALVDNVWQETDNVTPNAANKAASPESSAKGGGIIALKPCPDGKYRNPATNRCKKLESDDGLVPCKAGQYRNPESNRCRKIAASASTLVPCKAGQTRNPATNRCKKVDSSNGLKPCKEGQERNPETNRCRKVTTLASTNGTTPKDAAEEVGKRKTNYMIIGTVTSLALGYGIYEYRRDIMNAFSGLKTRLFPISSK